MTTTFQKGMWNRPGEWVEPAAGEMPRRLYLHCPLCRASMPLVVTPSTVDVTTGTILSPLTCPTVCGWSDETQLITGL